MNNETRAGLASIHEWFVGQLRISVFLAPEETLDSSDWLLELTGEPPEKTINEPRQGVYREETPYGDKGVLHLNIYRQTAKIDLLCLPLATATSETVKIPNLGSVVEAFPTFIDLGKTLLKLDSMPTVTRLAFGPTLIFPVENRISGYRLLGEHLPIDIDAENTSDFQYQINRPRPSTSGDAELLINRLSRWDIVTVTVNALSLKGAEQVRSSTGCRLVLDINTVPEFRGALTGEILDDFAELAREICTQGDIE